jgi:hypothetical protein
MSAKKVNPSNDDERVHLIALREKSNRPSGRFSFAPLARLRINFSKRDVFNGKLLPF